jgi:predicted DNA-binding protein (MmcQ/YjbR family)
MNLNTIRKYCLKKPGVSEDFPFGFDVLTIRVGSKIFALISIPSIPLRINLKCDPFLAMELRERYPALTPGYHMNKLHWNTVSLDGSIPDKEIQAMIDHSYELVADKLTRAEKNKIHRSR